jgi:curved DNA-binding protein CbpA
MQTVLRRFSRAIREKKQNYYQVLDVSQDASQKAIKAQFQKLTKAYHPDVYTGPEKERYPQVLKAYETLRNPIKRSKYDAETLRMPRAHKRKDGEGKDTSEAGEEARGEESGKERGSIFEEYYSFDPSEARVREEINRLQHRKVKTDFGRLNINETPMQRQMSEYEKSREKFVAEFNREKTLKDQTRTKMSYSEALKENIEFVNNAKAAEREAGAEPEEAPAWSKRLKALLQISLFAAFGVFAMATFDQKTFYRKQMHDVQSSLHNQIDDAVCREVRSRFVY